MTDWKEKVPLVAAYQQTKETWGEFDSSQRRAAILASTATFGRLGLRLAVENSQDSEQLSRTQSLVANIALDFADTIDGKIARAGNATTPWGKVADPLADKIDFAIQDIARVKRDELSGVEAGLRISRDVASTALRQYESLHPGGQGARTAASKWGKGSTIARSIANRVNDFAPQSSLARTTRRIATAGLMVSLGVNLRDFVRSRRTK